MAESRAVSPKTLNPPSKNNTAPTADNPSRPIITSTKTIPFPREAVFAILELCFGMCRKSVDGPISLKSLFELGDVAYSHVFRALETHLKEDSRSALLNSVEDSLVEKELQEGAERLLKTQHVLGMAYIAWYRANLLEREETDLKERAMESFERHMRQVKAGIKEGHGQGGWKMMLERGWRKTSAPNSAV